jgi:CubicO group peptidase (beta-lactamase class C family)
MQKVECSDQAIIGQTNISSRAQLTIKGTFQFQKAFGPKSPTEKISLDATFIMASTTKLMTTISALQCVERGQIGLDEDLSDILTEFKDLRIITGFNDDTDEAVLERAQNKITLR